MCQYLNPPGENVVLVRKIQRNQNLGWRQDTVIVRGEHHKTHPIRIQQTSVREIRGLRITVLGKMLKCPWRDFKKKHKHFRRPLEPTKNIYIQYYEVDVFPCFFFPKTGDVRPPADLVLMWWLHDSTKQIT